MQDPGMLGDEEYKKKKAAEKIKATIISAVKLTGAGFIICGTAILFDVAGAASDFGMIDPFVRYTLGSALCLAGVLDFIFIPTLLERKMR